MRWSRNATSSALTFLTRAAHSRSILSFEMRGTGFPAMRGSTTGMVSSFMLSGGDLELVARDPGQVGTFDSDQARVALAPRRVQIPLVVEIRGPGGELVGPDLLDLAGLSVRRLLHEAPVGHLGHPGHLAVDRPARAVVMRRAVPRSAIDVGENAEVQVGVLVENPAVRIRIGARYFATKSGSVLAL